MPRLRTILALLAFVGVLLALASRRGPASGSEVGAPTIELDSLTRDELYARARDLEIPGRSKMNKAELRDALRGL